ncbi:hypothetical protein FRB95_013350 [Tulasnella sp. JGI-2019a]|nr:hypothetical protein FRB95_013350 [Tulasnella sp. JGI-2019a]
MASRELSGSAGIYIRSIAGISLDGLQSLSSLIPIPYVTEVLAVASRLVKIAQTVQDNIKGVDLLIERVKAITLVVSTSVKGKTMQNVPKDLSQNIGRLRTFLRSRRISRKSRGEQILVDSVA